jgi:hypothetical protein
MKTIPFPTSYKKAILEKTKNTTIRVDEEKDKYTKGIYFATSYSGKNWGIKIKIKEVKRVKVKDLNREGIPNRSIESLKKKTGDSTVDLIRFDIL